MSAVQTRSPPARDELTRLVGAPCKVTRIGSTSNGHEPYPMTERDGELLCCPEIGAPLWLLIGATWLRTSPVADIRLGDGADTVVVVCTQNANYRLAFVHRLTAAPVA